MPTPRSFIKVLLSLFILFTLFTLQNSCSENGTEPNGMPDTTSHDYTWVVDTLGASDALQILMNGIWGTDEKNVWVIGHSDDVDYQIWHWDGTGWKTINPHIIGDRPSYMAILGFAENDIWIVGGGARRNPHGEGLLHREYIMHYDGSNWGRHSDVKAPFAFSIWGSSSSNLFVGCDSGIVLRYNGSEWEKDHLGNITQIHGLYSINGNDVYAAGFLNYEPEAKAYEFLYQENKWTLIDSFEVTGEKNIEKFGIHKWAADINNFYAVRPSWLYKYNGQNWDKLFNSIHFKDIYGSSANNIFAASIFNNVFHFNGSSWKRDAFFDPYRLGSSIKMWCNADNVFITAVSLIDNKFTSLNFRGTKIIKGGG